MRSDHVGCERLRKPLVWWLYQRVKKIKNNMTKCSLTEMLLQPFSVLPWDKERNVRDRETTLQCIVTLCSPFDFVFQPCWSTLLYQHMRHIYPLLFPLHCRPVLASQWYIVHVYCTMCVAFSTPLLITKVLPYKTVHCVRAIPFLINVFQLWRISRL